MDENVGSTPTGGSYGSIVQLDRISLCEREDFASSNLAGITNGELSSYNGVATRFETWVSVERRDGGRFLNSPLMERWQSWSIASDLKSEGRETGPWVRILLSPRTMVLGTTVCIIYTI